MLKNWCLTFLIKKIKCFIIKTFRIKTKNSYRVLEFSQSQWLKPFVEFNTQIIIEAEK